MCIKVNNAKILYISDVSLAVAGGAQESMQIIASGLADSFTFTILYPGKVVINKGRYSHSLIKSLDSLLIHKSPKKLLQIMAAIKKQIETIKPDLIHVQMPCSMIAVALLKSMGLISAPIIYTDRGRLETYSFFARAMVRKTIKHAEKVVLLTEGAKKDYLNFFPKYAEKYMVIPNTAGPCFEKHQWTDSESTYDDYDYKIIFCGRFHDDKNWGLAKQIIELLDKKYKCKFIVVLGSDSTTSNIEDCKKYIKELQNTVDKSDIDPYMDLSMEQIIPLYREADIFIMTSKTESFGRTAVEAMSQHCVVFSTNIPGPSEVVGFGDYLYDDINDFDLKFQSMDKKDINEIKSVFYRHYKNNYSLSRNLHAYEALYESILYSR